ncbi:MAG: TlpA family protein disulfide reductase [Saprospiraceae bacterium]|nr:TlpA family protein disulfide reductase [Saprospiraceae bacterium]
MKVVQTIPLDEKGQFQLEIAPENESQLYFLLIQKTNQKFDNYLTSFPWEDNYIALHLFPGNVIELQSQAESLSFSNRFLQADPTTASLQQLHNLRQPLADFIKDEYENAEDKNSFSFNIHGNEAIEETYHQAIDAFLDTCSQVLPLFTGLRMREPDNEFMDNPEFFIGIKDKIKKLAPNHPWNDQLATYFQADKLPLLKGESMPSFTLPSYKGDSLRLVDLKGKLILVDFWASWCAPCRKETRNTLVPLYEKYKDKGFEIAGISIDADEEVWRKAIEKDQAFWLHGCDFMGDESPIRESLRFVYIPSSYLLDENGKLIARNLHGEELIQYVDAFFSE